MPAAHPTLWPGDEVRWADFPSSVLLLPGESPETIRHSFISTATKQRVMSQECDVKLLPGNLYCVQGHNLYCQSHYHGDSSVPLSHDPQLKPNPANGEAQSLECFPHIIHSEWKSDGKYNNLRLTGQNQVSGEGEDSVSSSEPRSDDRMMGGRTRRRTKRIRTCFRREQLRALESYFAQKHNPDGKDWTCLAHKTGLPKRVLQVGSRRRWEVIRALSFFNERRQRQRRWDKQSCRVSDTLWSSLCTLMFRAGF